MLLHSPFYLLFLMTAAGLYWAIPGSQGRKVLLLGASLVFYAVFEVRFLILLGAIILVTQWIGAALPAGFAPAAAGLVWGSLQPGGAWHFQI